MDNNMDGKRILIASTQYPYYGGAATNAYALIKFFRSCGYRTAGLFITGAGNPINPENIEGIFNLPQYDIPVNNVASSIYGYLGGKPNVMLGKNYQAPITIKRMFPDQASGYLVAGCPQMAIMAKQGISVQKCIRDKIPFTGAEEIKCMQISDVIFPNNPIGHRLLLEKYNRREKIRPPVDTSFAMNNYDTEKIPFKERKFDIIFISSHLDRDVKNPELAIKIMKDPIFKNSKKIVVGKSGEAFKDIPNTTLAGFIDKGKDILKLIKNTKVLICPSFYDASPNVVKEAIISGCNVLLSKNCGWYEKYPKEFVCEDVYEIEEWKEKLSYLIENNLDFSYDINEERKKILKGLYLL